MMLSVRTLIWRYPLRRVGHLYEFLVGYLCFPCRKGRILVMLRRGLALTLSRPAPSQLTYGGMDLYNSNINVIILLALGM